VGAEAEAQIDWSIFFVRAPGARARASELGGAMAVVGGISDSNIPLIPLTEQTPRGSVLSAWRAPADVFRFPIPAAATIHYMLYVIPR
jgi:hypothetical protein